MDRSSPFSVHRAPGITVARRHLNIYGIVQGVGFRPFVHNLAGQLGLSGWVRNTATGVEMELQGLDPQLQSFLTRLQTDAPPLAHVISVELQPVMPVPDEPAGLVIRASENRDQEATPVVRTLISPDVATCTQCLHELTDPADRRYRYPFTNCTHCGPRFTIVIGLPYDRPLTTMAHFPLCPDCHREYVDPGDRRFHAQPTACPDCSPEVWYVSQAPGDLHRTGEVVGDDALKVAVGTLNEGGILAIKGLGGFHLSCRADHDATVQRLREAKARPHKPLAVMVSDVEMARRYCLVSQAEETLLTSPAAPIVLLRRRDLSGTQTLSELIAPQNGAVGDMLPYTALHHLLLHSLSVQLVMTSGNRPGEPLCVDNDEAWTQLGAMCDGFLLHDRPIARRCDDSVSFVAQLGREEAVVQPVRSSRSFAPVPVPLPAGVALSQPLVAAGADMKNVSAVAADRYVFLTQHVGNLDSPTVRDEQARAIADFEGLFNVRPQVIVCDLHPAYASSRYARDWAQKEGLRLLEVQHHHAHVAGCLAENGRSGTAIGLTFDGTGYGLDGNIWGGEILLADLLQFQRLFHLEYLPLPGGDAAIRRPYRTALAYLLTLCPQLDVTSLFPDVPPQEIEVLETMLAQGLNAPLTSSMGRLFDAVSTILGLCQESSYEAQAAIALEGAALQSEASGRYDFSLEGEEIRLAILLHQIVAERLSGVPVADIARRFHFTIAHMALQAAQAACTALPSSLPVALSGGVWQNRLLLEMTVPQLRQAGFEVLLHRLVPANDGGLAYGQAAVAAAQQQETPCA